MRDYTFNIPVNRNQDGSFAVSQESFKGFYLSYSPDDQRFHVSRNSDGTEVVARFRGNLKGWHNMLYYIKERIKR